MDEKELDKMAKDIEPIEEPKEEVKTQNSDGFVEDKETYVKPDGETTTSPVRTPNVIKEESSKGKWVFGGLATILILGLGASSTWLYMDAQNVRNELQSVKTGLEATRSDAAKLRDEVAAAKKTATTPSIASLTTDQLVEDTAEAYKAAATGATYTVRKEKVKGDFASLYMKAGATGAEPEMILLKKVKGQLIELKRISGVPTMSQEDATLLKNVYGIDVKELGITIE